MPTYLARPALARQSRTVPRRTDPPSRAATTSSLATAARLPAPSSSHPQPSRLQLALPRHPFPTTQPTRAGPTPPVPLRPDEPTSSRPMPTPTLLDWPTPGVPPRRCPTYQASPRPSGSGRRPFSSPAGTCPAFTDASRLAQSMPPQATATRLPKPRLPHPIRSRRLLVAVLAMVSPTLVWPTGQPSPRRPKPCLPDLANQPRPCLDNTTHTPPTGLALSRQDKPSRPDHPSRHLSVQHRRPWTRLPASSHLHADQPSRATATPGPPDRPSPSCSILPKTTTPGLPSHALPTSLLLPHPAQTDLPCRATVAPALSAATLPDKPSRTSAERPIPTTRPLPDLTQPAPTRLLAPTPPALTESKRPVMPHSRHNGPSPARAHPTTHLSPGPPPPCRLREPARRLASPPDYPSLPPPRLASPTTRVRPYHPRASRADYPTRTGPRRAPLNPPPAAYPVRTSWTSLVAVSPEASVLVTRTR